jgi:hypothetical protein
MYYKRYTQARGAIVAAPGPALFMHGDLRGWLGRDPRSTGESVVNGAGSRGTAEARAATRVSPPSMASIASTIE